MSGQIQLNGESHILSRTLSATNWTTPQMKAAESDCRHLTPYEGPILMSGRDNLRQMHMYIELYVNSAAENRDNGALASRSSCCSINNTAIEVHYTASPGGTAHRDTQCRSLCAKTRRRLCKHVKHGRRISDRRRVPKPNDNFQVNQIHDCQIQSRLY
jgi:hypothetical protein